MKKLTLKLTILSIVITLLAGCGGSQSKDEVDTSQAPDQIMHGPGGDTYTWGGYSITYPRTSKLVIISNTPIYGIEFFLYTEDTKPIEFDPNVIGACRYDETLKAWHIAVASFNPLNNIGLLNVPNYSKLEVVVACDFYGNIVTDYKLFEEISSK